jgi:uncharacterized protein YqgC (DUF456 family)
MNIWITIASGLLIVIGTLGAVLPFLPGLPVGWLGLLVYTIWGQGHNSSMADIWALVIFGVFTALTIVVDVFAPAIAARGHKASNYGVWGAMIGAVLGIFVMGPIGIIVGPFLGAFIGEMIHSANSEHAFRVAFASLFGLVIGSVFKLIVGTAMFIYFLITVF